MVTHGHQDPNTGSSRIRPERKEGMLLKKSKGALLLMFAPAFDFLLKILQASCTTGLRSG